MTEYNLGDRVRVVLEGDITWVAPEGIGFDVAKHAYVKPDADHVISIERIEKPLKVGDTILASRVRELPFNAVITEARDDGGSAVVGNGRVFFANGTSLGVGLLRSAYTIRFLPAS